MSGKRAVVALIGPIVLALALAGQAGRTPQPQERPQHTSVVVNIEVPVRVLRKDAFVDGLTIADFEVYENGVRQPLEAVYLIRDKKVLREEKTPGASPPSPPATRNYILFLDLKEYLPKIGDALDYFFAKALGPEDTLFVITPARTYRFKPEALARLPPLRISAQLKDKLKADVLAGNSEYRTLMRDFYRLEEEEYPPELADLKEAMLFEYASKMRDTTELSESQVVAFADSLKSLHGEKHAFLFFQKDVLPDHKFDDDRQRELLKPVSFDVDRIKRIFSDASVTVHFLFITKTPAFALNSMNQRQPVVASRLPELSSDIYASFREMASATGGLSESTANPDFAMRQAVEASGNFYLLYYRPVDYKADGRFREIAVKIRGEGIKVTHRLGYIAD